MEAVAFSNIANARTASSSATGESLGQAEFLRLLTTQLTNQSPLDPMDNEAFVAQMAQFSSVSGIAEMNESIKGLRSDLSGDRLGEAAAYVGRTALVPAAQISPGGEPVNGAVSLASSAARLLVEITDRAGNSVRKLELGPQDAGPVGFRWDGLDADGRAAGDGPFRINATMMSEQGRELPAPLYVEGHVASVALENNTTMLSITGIGSVRADQVKALS
ncbi:flagellar hook capping protein [Pacificimonas sp. WHA3]|uniref:Basal-body rod modification protein FlgD n=1 Tax=Pacificimonas pallii TaxID=2827236 RepID=A0ABS6SG39_9SPHN|nr:flagellar hook capping FlgD N-terminal domain-containing protein [Pacificimonas pallii]MBV7257013.1 flagellar hook capping protein [Pacificimonas pallii]